MTTIKRARALPTVLVLVLASAAVILAGPPDGSASRGHHVKQRDTVWVTNRDRGEVAVFDARTGELLTPTPITVGRGAHDIVVSHRAGKAYVANETDDTLSVISASTLDVLLPALVTGDGPHHVSVGRGGRTVYVGLVNTNTIALIDTATDTEVARYTSSAISTDRAHAPYPSRHGRFIFVPHETGNRLTILDGETGDLVASTEPGLGPSEVLPTRSGRFLWVSLRNDARVKRFDLWGRQPTVEVPLGTGMQPESLILTPDERTLIVTLRNQLARLAFIDTRTLTLTDLVEIGGATLEEHGVDIPPASTFGDLAVRSPDGRYVYATFDSLAAGRGGVAVVDVQRRKKVATWVYPEKGRVHGIAYSTTRLRLD